MSVWHLAPAVLIDLAEGTQPEHAFPHLISCAHCQRQLAELRAALTMAASDVEVPEPSPLFWDHLSSRIRDSVASEALSPRSTRAGGWIDWKWATLGSVAAVAVAVALVVYSTPRRSRGPIAPVSLTIQSAENQVGAQGSAEAPFNFVADLAEALDWEAAAEAGLTTRLGIIDRTLAELSSDERIELERLLNEALAKPGA